MNAEKDGAIGHDPRARRLTWSKAKYKYQRRTEGEETDENGAVAVMPWPLLKFNKYYV